MQIDKSAGQCKTLRMNAITVVLTSCAGAGGRHTMRPRPCELTFDLLTLKVVSESRVTWATSVPILVFLGLSVLDLSPMYATDRQTDDRQIYVRQHHRLIPPPIRGGA